MGFNRTLNTKTKTRTNTNTNTLARALADPHYKYTLDTTSITTIMHTPHQPYLIIIDDSQ